MKISTSIKHKESLNMKNLLVPLSLWNINDCIFQLHSFPKKHSDKFYWVLVLIHHKDDVAEVSKGLKNFNTTLSWGGPHENVVDAFGESYDIAKPFYGEITISSSK